MVTLSFVRNSTSPSCTYLWRATLASCFARLDRETPNTGSQFLWLPSLPFLCSMPLSGKTHPAQVTRLLHSTTAEGSVLHAASTISEEIPHLILFWDQEYLLQEGTACSGSLSGVLMLWSSRDAEGPQDCSAPSPPSSTPRLEEGREGGLWDREKGCTTKTQFPVYVISMYGPFLCTHKHPKPRCFARTFPAGQDGGLHTYKDNAEALVGQTADNFQ